MAVLSKVTMLFWIISVGYRFTRSNKGIKNVRACKSSGPSARPVLTHVSFCPVRCCIPRSETPVTLCFRGKFAHHCHRASAREAGLATARSKKREVQFLSPSLKLSLLILDFYNNFLSESKRLWILLPPRPRPRGRLVFFFSWLNIHLLFAVPLEIFLDYRTVLRHEVLNMSIENVTSERETGRSWVISFAAPRMNLAILFTT